MVVFTYKVFNTNGDELYTFHSSYQIRVGDLVCQKELVTKQMGQNVKYIVIIADQVTTTSYYIHLFV